MPDVRGNALQHTLREDLHLPVDAVRTAALYTIHTPCTAEALEEARQSLFTDAIVQESYWDLSQRLLRGRVDRPPYPPRRDCRD